MRSSIREHLSLVTELYSYLVRIVEKGNRDLCFEVALKSLVMMIIYGLLNVCKLLSGEDREFSKCLSALRLPEVVISKLKSTDYSTSYESMIKYLNDLSLSEAKEISNFLRSNYCLIIRKLSEELEKP